MKNRILLFFAFVLTISGASFGQLKTTVTQYVELYAPLKVCEGDTVTISCGYHAYPEDHYFKKIANGNPCWIDISEIKDNHSVKWEGNGLQVIRWEYNPWHRLEAVVKITADGPIRLSWTERRFYPETDCSPARTDEFVFIGISTKVLFVPKPPKPTITASKAVYKPGEVVTLTASPDCPNSLKNQTDYPNMNVGSDVGWAVDCDSRTGLPFWENYRLHGQSIKLGYNEADYRPAGMYVCRCNDNGCLSDISDPVGIIRQGIDAPVCDNLPDFVAARADASVPGSPGYHHFFREVTVCDVTSGNPNCTVDKVFDKLRRDRDLSLPKNGDRPPSTVPEDGPSWVKQLVFSELIDQAEEYLMPEISVEACRKVGVPGMATWGALAALEAGMGGSGGWTEPLADILLRVIGGAANAMPFLPNGVVQAVDYGSKSIITYTLPGNILHYSKVIRTVVQHCDKIKVITVGTGNSQLGDNHAGRLVGDFMSDFLRNQYGAVDGRLIKAFDELPR